MFTVFRGGQSGAWRVTRLAPVKGARLSPTPALSVGLFAVDRAADHARADLGRLAGIAGHVRYTEHAEKERLATMQAGSAAPRRPHAALIPIKKSAAWWELTQEERRQIFEDESQHIAASLKYLPAIARQLYHCRDFGEPFDFLTWFEFAPTQAETFEELVGTLRATEEWSYVEREVDIPHGARAAGCRVSHHHRLNLLQEICPRRSAAGR